MAYLKQQLYRKNSSGGYDKIYFKNLADNVFMSVIEDGDGASIADEINSITRVTTDINERIDSIFRAGFNTAMINASAFDESSTVITNDNGDFIVGALNTRVFTIQNCAWGPVGNTTERFMCFMMVFNSTYKVILAISLHNPSRAFIGCRTDVSSSATGNELDVYWYMLQSTKVNV